jgi:hypothetical protein
MFLPTVCTLMLMLRKPVSAAETAIQLHIRVGGVG